MAYPSSQKYTDSHTTPTQPSYFHSPIGPIDSNTQIIKATNAATKEIIGLICWTIEYTGNGKPIIGERLPDLNATASQLPEFLDMAFLSFYTKGLDVDALKNNLMKGHTYYCKSSPFLTAPKYMSPNKH
ncbi:hypothetical protein NHQ30_003884 [Ciborinia camelliae]|nr:hypothetical protein NHQ30_003884 [Ciborinia camelliae]